MWVPGAALGGQPPLVEQVEQRLWQPARPQLGHRRDQVHHIELGGLQLVRLCPTPHSPHVTTCDALERSMLENARLIHAYSIKAIKARFNTAQYVHGTAYSTYTQ